MGLFSRARNDPAFGDRVRAAIAYAQGDTGAASRFQQLQLERQRLAQQQQAEARQQAEMARALEVSGRQQEAAQALGWSKDQISAVTPGDLSQLVRERFTPRQFGAEGGSVRNVAPDGTETYSQAPSEREINGGIIRTSPEGISRSVYEGGHYVPVTEGGGVAVFNSRGQGGWGVAPDSMGGRAPGPPRLGPVPQNGAIPPVQVPVAPQTPPQLPTSADTRPENDPAPAFNPNPTDLASAPPLASIRGIQFGAPVANMPRVGQRPRSGNSRAAQLRQSARSAINRGANRDAVRARLRQMGVSDRGL